MKQVRMLKKGIRAASISHLTWETAAVYISESNENWENIQYKDDRMNSL